jgi:hypothetical protein
MKLIVLAGLPVYEKAEFASELARMLLASGRRVTLIDNGARPVEPPSGVTVRRIAGGCVCCSLAEQLYQVMAEIDQGVAVLIASESAHPEALRLILENLRAGQPGLEFRLLALVDDRTCDCFPHVRQMLEDAADDVLYPPFAPEEALAAT